MELSHSMPQQLQNVVKKHTNKQTKNKAGVPITELLNICTYTP